MKFDNIKSLPKKFDKKLILIVAVSVVLVAGLVVFLALHHNSSNKAKLATEYLEPGYNQTEDELNDNKQQAEILITADGPQPQTLRIPVDTQIGWKNQDSKEHEIAISPGSKIPDKFYNYRKIDPSGGYLFVIHKTGTFHYYDVTTPTNNGVIIVSDK